VVSRPRPRLEWFLGIVRGGGRHGASIATGARPRQEQRKGPVCHAGRQADRTVLSHKNAPNKVDLARRHATLSRCVRGIVIPSPGDEAANPSVAEEVYAACTKFLIGRSRDDKLLLQENTNYGFRRNLWGLKPFGVAISAMSTVVLGLRLFTQFASHLPVSPLVAVFEGCNVIMLILWLAVVSPKWVMMPALAYAERLMETLDRLEAHI